MGDNNQREKQTLEDKLPEIENMDDSTRENYLRMIGRWSKSRKKHFAHRSHSGDKRK
jgi:hypothetical protein